MEFKNKLKYTLLITIVSMLILFCGYFAIPVLAEQTKFGAQVVLNAEPTLNVIKKEIIKSYAYKAPSYKKIKTFPINASVFNSSADYFCAQHGTPYGSSARAKYLGDATAGYEYHTDFLITNHKVSSSITVSDNASDDYIRELDIPSTSTPIYMDKYGVVHKNNLSVYTSYRDVEVGTENRPINYLYTNWVYIPHYFQFDCESLEGNSRNVINNDKVGSGMFGDGAMAFLLACFKQSDSERASTGYQKDPLQMAVWDWLGQGGGSPLTPVAKLFEDYHKKSKEPNVDTKPADNVGTTISGSTYQIGPFEMSDYVRAQDFTFGMATYNVITITKEQYDRLPISEQNKYSQADDNEYIRYEQSSSGVAGSDNLQNRFTSVQSKNGSDADLRGTIIKAEAIFTNESGATKSVEFTVPEPNSTFYVSVSDSQVQGFDELLDIKFTYQRVHASGAGTWYQGLQEMITYDGYSSSQKSSCSYDCTVCKHTGIGYSVRSAAGYSHNYWCGGSGYCQHGYSSFHCSSCGGTNSSSTYHCSGTKNSGWVSDGKGGGSYTSHTHTSSCYCSYYACSKTYCSHGHYDGKHSSGTCKSWGSWHQDICYADTRCPSHDHLTCFTFKWNTPPKNGGDYAQDAFAGAGLLSTEINAYTIRVSVPMKTQMSIYKYITKVEHVGEAGVIFNSNERRDRTMEEKYNDPVKVERGDLVTYTIELVNDSRFETRVKVQDILPEGCEPTYAGLVDCTLEEMPNQILTRSWINIPAKNKVVMLVKVRPTQPEGKYTNIIEFITRNDTPEHMQFVEWGTNGKGKPATHGPNTNGSIVNTRVEGNTSYTTDLKEKDSDTYEIKQYNVNIDKYIYDVNHEQEHVATSLLDTSIGNSHERSVERGTTEDMKKANPVYVEYGDTVTYLIKVYNTTNQYDSSINRKDAPYWEPDKVYVNIEDTLPKKYTDLKVEVDNGTGAINIGQGKFTIKNMMVPANGVTTVTVTLVVDEHTKGTIETNSVKFIDKIRNINKGPGNENNVDDKFCVIKNNPLKEETNDYYILNDYDAFIDKYLYQYDEAVRNENVEFGLSVEQTLTESRNGDSNVLKSYQGNDKLQARERLADNVKQTSPVPVEKDETITYQIKVTNEAVSKAGGMTTSKKPATQVRSTQITDLMEQGIYFLDVQAKQYKADGSICDRYFISGNVGVTAREVGTVSQDGRTYTKYVYEIGPETILNPGEYIVYTVKARVVQSDLYLYDLDNLAELTILTNINHKAETKKDREIKNPSYNENISKQQKSHEYVRMKDLIIAGKVWLDFNKNGLMDDTIADYIAQTKSEYAFDAGKLSTYYSINGNAMMKDIPVKLYKSDGTLVRTTKTDSNGLFTFSRSDGLTFYETQYYNLDPGRKYDPNKTYERLDKATGKDGNGNYTSGAQYIYYYIEYEYDGVVYKATAYSGKEHLNNNGSYKGSSCGHTFETNTERYAKDDYTGELKPNAYYKYEYDSNANEFTSAREEFNTRYEYITYNKAYDTSLNPASQNGKDTSNLDFDKDGHTSRLLVNPDRAMIARSFILSADDVNSTEYIPLFDYDKVKRTVPYSRYLKFINLGLELREDVDISLTKDVYKVKTTIKGQEMEYNFNKNFIVNGKTLDGNAANNYMLDKAYGLELYESDYKYRNEQYSSVNAVLNYLKDSSELNVEVTYRIRVNNNQVDKDDDLVDPSSLKNGYNGDNFKDTDQTKLFVKVDELLDLYDENFIKFTDEMESGSKPDYIDVRELNPLTGRFKDEDKQVKIAEAWYYVPAADGTYIFDSDSGIYVDISEGIAVPEGAQKYKVVPMKISNNSLKGTTNPYITGNKYESDGYNKLFIRPNEAVIIPEGGYCDFFVKYVLDKGNEVITNTNSSFGETKSTAVSGSNISTNEDGSVTGKWYWEDSSTTGGTILSSSLKIAEKTNKAKSLGLENIAQVNMYSVWYDAVATKPASIVDKDSNVGNVGMKDTSGSGTVDSAENKDIYEDTIYKTGIDITAKGTANTPPDRSGGSGSGEVTITIDLLRKINGHVWDDSRSEENSGQFLGNGLRNIDTEEAIKEAKKNELVPIVKDGKTEETDIHVSSAKAEFIEIIETAEDTYYEMIPTDVLYDWQQHIRTNENGEYELYGYTPGKYVVRFTYGDEIPEGENGSQDDMYLFNGQDYKSTQYTMPDNPAGDTSKVLDDSVVLYNETNLSDPKAIVDANNDKIDKVIESLRAPDFNDARDDEIRRLEVNGYSEIMDNMMAEILQGMANGAVTKDGKTLTNNDHANSKEELQALVDNTWMFAETIPFVIRTEKIDPSVYTDTIKKMMDTTYATREQVENQIIDQRTFVIENIDFGIEYRPENLVQLEKEIKEVKVTTESGEVVVDLFFRTDYENTEYESAKTHYLDTEKSVGLDLIQFISNEYNTLLDGLISERGGNGINQGFVFINYDTDIQQGATIEITYEFIAENRGEIDRISKHLDDIRYYKNYETERLDQNNIERNVINGNVNKNTLTNYRANLTAANDMINQLYNRDDQGIIYRMSPKVLTTTSLNTDDRKTNNKDGANGASRNVLSYYGYYVGYEYYTGEVTGFDTIAELKFNKILDYVDKDLVYLNNSTGSEVLNKNWTVLNNTYGEYSSMIDWARSNPSYIAYVSGSNNITAQDVLNYINKMIKDQDIVSAYLKNTDDLRGGLQFKTDVGDIAGASIDPEGYIYNNMLITTDTAINTDIYVNAERNFPTELVSGTNPSLSRFLIPKVSDSGTNDYEGSRGRIELTVSKAISAETGDDELEYQNIAEVVEFTTLTGRRTNFAVTIGNVDVRKSYVPEDDPGKPKDRDNPEEYPQSIPEPDEATTEVITLIPPQGLFGRNRVVREVVEIAKTGTQFVIIVGAVAAIVIFVTLFTIKKFRKRRIK